MANWNNCSMISPVILLSDRSGKNAFKSLRKSIPSQLSDASKICSFEVLLWPKYVKLREYFSE